MPVKKRWSNHLVALDMWLCENYDLLVALDKKKNQGSPNSLRFNNICTKFHVNLSNSWVCEALFHYCLGDNFVRFVTSWVFYMVIIFNKWHIYNNFSADKDGTAFMSALFCDLGWWDGCYSDRNILPCLAQTARVVKFVWICCHVISFCSNYSQLIGKGKGLSKPLCQCLADKGCSDITPVLLEQLNYRKK